MKREGRVALITGSGRKRVGWHVADALAARGLSIAVHYHTATGEVDDTLEHLRGHGVEAEKFRADLSDEDEVETLADDVLDRFGRVDLLANCAAIWESKPLEEVRGVDVRRHFEVNVLGTFLLARRVGLAMVEQREGGCIVNFGDWAESRPYREYAAYFATKGGIPTLTRCLAVELGTRNPRVRVNAILPGPAMMPDDLPAEDRRSIVDSLLVGGEGRPEHLVMAVEYLMKNDFVTGTCLAVDGGRTVYAAGL